MWRKRQSEDIGKYHGLVKLLKVGMYREIQTWDHYIHQDMSEADLDSETELSTREKAKIKHYQEAHWGCWKM